MIAGAAVSNARDIASMGDAFDTVCTASTAAGAGAGAGGGDVFIDVDTRFDDVLLDREKTPMSARAAK